MLSLRAMSQFFIDYLQLTSIINQIDAQQVVVIRNEKYETIFERQLAKWIPTWQVSLSNVTLKLNQSSALFVWINDPWISIEIERQRIHQLRQMSIDTFRSKFLIIQTNDNERNEMTLRFAWQELLLDVTIFDWQHVHYYNPFSDKYFRIRYNTSTRLFPNKMTNLHKYQLKVGVLDYPPYSTVKYKGNGSFEYKFVFGELLKSLSTTANFKIKPDIVKLAGYGVLKNDGTATGLIGKVMKGELDFVAFGAFLFYSPFNSAADRTTYINVDEGCPVVPLILSNKTHLFLAESVQASIVTIVVLVVVVYLFSLLLRLNARLWHPLNVIFLILGVSVSNLPKLLRDRFLYGCIMVVSLFYSSTMFAQLTSVGVDTGGFKPFESLKDLDDSGLVPMLHPNILNITFKFTDDKYLQSLGKKAKAQPDFADSCPKWLMSYQNVSCVFENLIAQVQVKTHKDSQGKDLMKIGKPCFWSVTRSFILPRSSPYTSRFNQIIRMVEQSGLQDPWFLRAFYASKKMKNLTVDEENDRMLSESDLVDMLKDDTAKSARYFVVVGHIAATFVFIGEIFIFRARKWRARRKIFAYVH